MLKQYNIISILKLLDVSVIQAESGKAKMLPLSFGQQKEGGFSQEEGRRSDKKGKIIGCDQVGLGIGSIEGRDCFQRACFLFNCVPRATVGIGILVGVVMVWCCDVHPDKLARDLVN